MRVEGAFFCRDASQHEITGAWSIVGIVDHLFVPVMPANVVVCYFLWIGLDRDETHPMNGIALGLYGPDDAWIQTWELTTPYVHVHGEVGEIVAHPTLHLPIRTSGFHTLRIFGNEESLHESRIVIQVDDDAGRKQGHGKLPKPPGVN